MSADDLISASSVGFAIVLKLHFIDFIEFLLWVVFVDCIGVGVVIATALWCVSILTLSLLGQLVINDLN